MAVIATLSKGYDLDYSWKQVDQSPAKDAASYYIQASESGGEPPGRWWGPGAQALGLEQGQLIEREPYDLLFGEHKAPDGTQLGKPPGSGRKAADIYTNLLAAEPHATAACGRHLGRIGDNFGAICDQIDHADALRALARSPSRSWPRT